MDGPICVISRLRLGGAEKRVKIVYDDNHVWFAGEGVFFKQFVGPSGGIGAIPGLKRNVPVKGYTPWIFDLKKFAESGKAKEHSGFCERVFGREVAHWSLSARLEAQG